VAVCRARPPSRVTATGVGQCPDNLLERDPVLHRVKDPAWAASQFGLNVLPVNRRAVAMKQSLRFIATESVIDQCESQHLGERRVGKLTEDEVAILKLAELGQEPPRQQGSCAPYYLFDRVDAVALGQMIAERQVARPEVRVGNPLPLTGSRGYTSRSGAHTSMS
jgi:hypothetical protein